MTGKFQSASLLACKLTMPFTLVRKHVTNKTRVVESIVGGVQHEALRF